LREDFSFGVNSLPITLVANTGETHSGKIGDNFFFTAPASGPLLIDTVVGIDNTFASKEGLSLAVGFTWQILAASLGYNNVNFLSLGPLAQGSYPIASTGCLVCWTDTNFQLAGFNTLDNQLMIPVVTPEPAVFLLVGLGMIGLVVMSRVRRQRAVCSCLAVTSVTTTAPSGYETRSSLDRADGFGPGRAGVRYQDAHAGGARTESGNVLPPDCTASNQRYADGDDEGA